MADRLVNARRGIDDEDRQIRLFKKAIRDKYTAMNIKTKDRKPQTKPQKPISLPDNLIMKYFEKKKRWVYNDMKNGFIDLNLKDENGIKSPPGDKRKAAVRKHSLIKKASGMFPKQVS